MVVHEERVTSLDGLDRSSNLWALGGIVREAVPVVISNFAIKVRTVLCDWLESILKARYSSCRGSMEMNDSLDVRTSGVDGIMYHIGSNVRRAVNQIFRSHLTPHFTAWGNEAARAVPSRNVVPHEHIHVVLGRKTMSDGKIIAKSPLFGLSPFIGMSKTIVIFDNGLDLRYKSLTDCHGIRSVMRENEAILQAPKAVIGRKRLGEGGVKEGVLDRLLLQGFSKCISINNLAS
mmetsp:Transcript_10737/g.23284  ORF Transcript_10737/g.23284 Transcript_10737/m.23284 type:complete len:233 (-) Transcript_10737:929-1627(-)